MRLEAWRLYQEAIVEYRTGNLEKSRHLIGKLRIFAAHWPRTLLLEAYVQRAEGNYVTEVQTLRKLLSRLRMIDIDERELAADAWSLLGTAQKMLGCMKDSMSSLLQASALEQELVQKRVEYSNVLFASNHLSELDADSFQELYRGYQQLLQDVKPCKSRSYMHKKLRIGYLSADFHEHPIAFLLWPLLCHHDRQNFEIYCYASNKSKDWITKKMQLKVKYWREIADLSDAEAAAQIQQDEIDILFELSGHGQDNRLPVLAYRPASIQISGIGYMGSTGMLQTDYFLTDSFCAPQGEERFFTERLLRMPRTHFCYAPLKDMPEPEVPPVRQRGYITFGCFNNFSKVTDELLFSWKELLRRLPTARLILKHRVFDSSEGRGFVKERLEKAGLPLERIELRGFSADYLVEYHDVDIALDTYPYTGGVTTLEALYMGVPVVSLYGERHGTRLGYSILSNVGIQELSAANVSEYIEKAVSLAEDEQLLSLLHRNLRGMMQSSALMDGTLYAQDVESLYRQISMKTFGNED